MPKIDANDIARERGSAGLAAELDRLEAEAPELAAPVSVAQMKDSTPSSVPVEPGSSADGRRLPSALLSFNVHDDPLCLLGNRWLGRGGGAFLFAETGQGKSVLVMQAAILWALGRPFFGIAPKFPLRVALWQAENDDGDCAEMLQGIVKELDLGAFAGELDERLRITKETQRRGKELIDFIRPTMIDWHPDLGILDPYFSYLDGEISNSKDNAAFLRGLLNPLAAEVGNAWLIVHHEPKPSRKRNDTNEKFNASYAGHGSAEQPNWARATLKLSATQTGFELSANKRGKRSGLVDAEGNPATTIALRHSEKGICWLPDTVAVNWENEEVEATAKEVIKKMPVAAQIDKDAVREMVQEVAGVTRGACYPKNGKPTKANRIWLRVMDLCRVPGAPGYFSRVACRLPVASLSPVTPEVATVAAVAFPRRGEAQATGDSIMDSAIASCLDTAPDSDQTVLDQLDPTEWRGLTTVHGLIQKAYQKTSAKAARFIVTRFEERHNLASLHRLDGEKDFPGFRARRERRLELLLVPLPKPPNRTLRPKPEDPCNDLPPIPAPGAEARP